MKHSSFFVIAGLLACSLILPAPARAGIVQEQQAQIDDLLERVAVLESLLQNVSREGDEIYFDGVNVNIRNGLGATNGDPEVSTNSVVNGTGNLVIGYNEARPFDSDKSGSHNLVLGPWHNYSSHGGFVAGSQNAISGVNSTICGGGNNEASGIRSTICGGGGHVASGMDSTVSGGRVNTASGDYSSVSGGDINEASGLRATVSGGFWNIASGTDSSVQGGSYNEASARAASVSGGNANHASGYESSVSGGVGNTASGYRSTVGGGELREASGSQDWVAGSLFEDN